jgi:hypothetical protein
MGTKDISFDGANGSAPFGALIQSKDGTLYGTTLTGGKVASRTAMGVVFSLSAGLPPPTQ